MIIQKPHVLQPLVAAVFLAVRRPAAVALQAVQA